MPRPEAPRLDDLSAQDLVTLALDRLAARGHDWTASDAADPGRILIEAFATITAEELRRLNALPEALQTRFLTTLGVQLIPGRAEATTLHFARAAPGNRALCVPAGLRVALRDAPAVVFTLLEDVAIPPGATGAEGVAARVNRVPLHPVGRGSGTPAQRVTLPHDTLAGAPDAAARIAVRVLWEGTPPQGAQAITLPDGRVCIPYTLTHGAPAQDMPQVQADRAGGQLIFPADGPFMPPLGAEIQAGYCHLQGLDPLEALPGPGDLDDPLDPLPGITVSNRTPVVEGAATETAAQRVARGPVSTFASSLAMRPREYEALSRSVSSAVARAHASTPAANWAFAQPGRVDVLIAPQVRPDAHGAVTHAAYEAATARHTDLLEKVRARLEQAAPLGVGLRVRWLAARPVSVACTLYVSPGMSHEDVRLRALDSLGAYLSPMPSETNGTAGGWPDGWPLGRSLRQSEVIERLNCVPGVRAVDRVTLRPGFPMMGEVTALAADAAQPGLWFAIVGGKVYRTLDGGTGWTRLPLNAVGGVSGGDAAPAAVTLATHPVRCGLIAIALQDGRILTSEDGGQTLHPVVSLPPGLDRLAWADGSEAPRLLCGGAGALKEVTGALTGLTAAGSAALPRELLAGDGAVVPAITAIATHPDGRGNRYVAVALRALKGVLLSDDSGWDGSFAPGGLAGSDIRSLCFVQDGGRTWLLAGSAERMVAGQSAVYRAEISGAPAQVGPWAPCDSGWPGGTVESLAFDGRHLFAASRTQGLLRAEWTPDRIAWRRLPDTAGLPAAAGSDGPAPMTHVACGRPEDGARTHPVMAAGPDAMLHTRDSGARFDDVALRAGTTRIGLPANWTLCAARHEIEVRDVTT